MNIHDNISLRGLNSFGVEARAARLVEWESEDELATVCFDGRWMALGGGNNILFTKDFDGTLVKSAARGIEITGQDAGSVSVRARAGVDWNDFVTWCGERGLWGAENLAGIPGTVGAAPIQNIGAYGAEAKDIIASVECFVVGGGTRLTLAAEHCAFGYRDSVFKRELRGKVIVMAVNFVLSKEPRPNLHYAALAEKTAEFGEPTPESISRAVISIRDSKLPDPSKTGNAGSFFKNPVVDVAIAHELAAIYPAMPVYPAVERGKSKLAAGWLIEQAGWKGRVEGHVGIHPKQALIVVNTGGATGAEIVEFARKVQSAVREKFGVELETEVNIVC
ncbi:MAG: UDP-N-acetylmuramate dehydrogenase [Alistipes sp.]|jgi:UDP-N-acetylmuramate dehydrogenase|nr:UDP-N-acetylmuramate dehydrogenase [Alistipes sp.]